MNTNRGWKSARSSTPAGCGGLIDALGVKATPTNFQTKKKWQRCPRPWLSDLSPALLFISLLLSRAAPPWCLDPFL